MRRGHKVRKQDQRNENRKLVADRERRRHHACKCEDTSSDSSGSGPCPPCPPPIPDPLSIVVPLDNKTYLINNDHDLQKALEDFAARDTEVDLRINHVINPETPFPHVYKFPNFISDTTSSISIIGDTRPVVGMSYVNGAQTDTGARFPEGLIAPEIGSGSDVAVLFRSSGNAVDVIFQKPSAFFPPFVNANPNFNSLRNGDRVRIWDPRYPDEEVVVNVASANGDRINFIGTPIPEKYIPAVLGTTITILPCIVFENNAGPPGFPDVNRFVTLGDVSFKGIQFIERQKPPSTKTPFDLIQLQGQDLFFDNCVVDTKLYNTSRRTVNAQPNTFTRRLVFNAATHPFLVMCAFVGPKSALWSESNAYAWVIFSTWVGSNNSEEVSPDVPRAGLIGVNGTQICTGWSSFIKCPGVPLSLSASQLNVQHNIFDSCGKGIEMLYGSKIYSNALPSYYDKRPDVNPFPLPETFATIRNCGNPVVLLLKYGCIASVPKLVVEGGNRKISVDGDVQEKGPLNNWSPEGNAPPSKYGSYVYHS